jgi:hypothetical protein
VALDALATRYNKLPSELLREADTFDFKVFDIALSYKNYMTDRQNKVNAPPQFTEEQMYKMMEKARG